MTAIREGQFDHQPTTEPEAEAAEAGFGVVVGVLVACVGVFALVMPLLTGAVLSVWLGVLLVVVGIVRVEDLKRREAATAGEMATELLRAAGYVLLGVLLVVFTFEPSRLAVVLAIPLLLDGVGRLTGVLHRGAERGYSAALGLVLVLIAALLIGSWPSDAAWALGSLFGLGLVVVGVAVALDARRRTRGMAA